MRLLTQFTTVSEIFDDLKSGVRYVLNMPRKTLFLLAALCVVVFAAVIAAAVFAGRKKKSRKKSRRDPRETHESSLRRGRTAGLGKEPGVRAAAEKISEGKEPPAAETEHLYVYIPPDHLRICRYCGSENPPGGAVCHCCGEKL